ncbi:hypothetical protein JZ751_022457 [Albula glossodonta]|uniref:RGS domain-containing protein n=1 Tax=Albula glossodonta TaxID=121402 RepID=A0A8T2NL83_9TELE|nr:hypothetical protein JZ751_022457 [Albula glossodonta]
MLLQQSGMTSSHSPSLGPRNHHAILEAAGPSHVAINAISANMDSFARGRTAILKKQPSHMEAAHFGDLGRSSVNYQAQETRSRLSKTVEQILRDTVALPYYIQFMETQGADHLVKFWLEAESFRATSWSRVRAHSLNSVKHSSLAEPASPSAGRPESEESSSGSPPPHALTPSPPDTNSHSPGPGTGGGVSHGNALQSDGSSIERDAVNIFTKYISPDAARSIPITEAVRNDIVAKICGEDGQVDPNCFVTAQFVVFSIMEQQHFTEFLRSHHFCKYQIEVLTSGTVFLADILFCESALFYFSEYMEKEEAVNILQFWLAADNFQDQLAAKKGQYDGQEAQNDAMILYDKEGGPLPDCFTTPLRQAWTTMEKVYMPGFLSSNLYYKYLNDLINSVRADEFFGGHSVAPGQGVSQDGDRTKKAAIKILKNFDEAITVDIASLDPERMTFGKVNELGQFIREAEPEPDVKKSKGSMFSQAMKKWVQGNSDEAQEEMAWKIAKMIVNDVMHQAHHEQPAMTFMKNQRKLRTEAPCSVETRGGGITAHCIYPMFKFMNEGRTHSVTSCITLA